MTANEKIMAAVSKALRYELLGLGVAPGTCLKDVRLILEDAFGWKPGEFYKRHRTEIVETPSADSPRRWTRDPQARDLERSLKAQGMEVPREELLPGDLLFNWRSAPYHREQWLEDYPGTPFPDELVYIGHVAIYVGLGMMLENINPLYRPYGFTRKNLSLTPLAYYEQLLGPMTTVIRFAPKEGANA